MVGNYSNLCSIQFERQACTPKHNKLHKAPAYIRQWPYSHPRTCSTQQIFDIHLSSTSSHFRLVVKGRCYANRLHDSAWDYTALAPAAITGWTGNAALLVAFDDA
jgi:hypothetical protein